MRDLPIELWQEIGVRSDVETVKALRRTSQWFSSLLTDDNYRMLCKRNGVRMLPDHIQDVIASHPSLTVDFLTLFHYNPFGSNVGRFGAISPINLSPYVLSDHLDDRGRINITPLVTLSPPETDAILESRGEIKRGSLVYKLDLEKIGIPGWLLDVFHPRLSLTVHAYRMPDTNGDILVSAKLLRSEEEGSVAVCKKEHQGWFMAGWQASDRAVEESVHMDFEVYGEGARVLNVIASCSGGGRLGEIEVSLHFPSSLPADVEEQLTRWTQNEKKKVEEEEEQIIQTSECRTILGVERNEIVLRSTATISLSRISSVSSTISMDSGDDE